MKRLNAIAGVMLLLATGTVGCISPDRHVEEHWGESYAELKEQQIQNPSAGDDVRPVEGLGATSADHVTTNYHTRQDEQFQDEDDSSIFELINSN
jgi:hypothetical protein